MVKPKMPIYFEAQTVRQVDVTELTPSQRRQLFEDCMNQKGFAGFIKNKTGKQTYYTFTYHNEN